MEPSMDRSKPETIDDWSESYRSHAIAGRRSGRQWLLLIDGKRQEPCTFGGREEAMAWLRQRVDALIAEKVFPGLRLERLNADGLAKDHLT